MPCPTILRRALRATVFCLAKRLCSLWSENRQSVDSCDFACVLVVPPLFAVGAISIGDLLIRQKQPCASSEVVSRPVFPVRSCGLWPLLSHEDSHQFAEQNGMPFPKFFNDRGFFVLLVG